MHRIFNKTATKSDVIFKLGYKCNTEHQDASHVKPPEVIKPELKIQKVFIYTGEYLYFKCMVHKSSHSLNIVESILAYDSD